MSEPAKKTGNPLVGCLALVVMGGIAWWFLDGSGSAGTPAPANVPAAPAWQPPAGFALSKDDPTVAIRWMDASETDCTYSSASCWGIEAIAHVGCPSNLYIELSLLDASGAAIGYTNDTVGGVSPDQHAKLTFDTFEDGARKARISEVTCY